MGGKYRLCHFAILFHDTPQSLMQEKSEFSGEGAKAVVSAGGDFLVELGWEGDVDPHLGLRRQGAWHGGT